MKISQLHQRFFLSLLFMLTVRICIAQNQYYKIYGTPHDDVAVSLDRCGDGGYYITGRTNTSSFREDGFIIRTNSSGEMLWNKIIQFDTASVHYVTGAMLNDESILLIFREYNPVYQIVTTLIKLNSNGDSLWTRTFIGTDICCITKPVIPLSNGEFLLAGRRQFFMGEEYSGLVMKFDSSGNTLVNTTFKCEGLEVVVNDYKMTPDSEIVLVGGLMEHIQTHEPHSFLLKISMSGDLISGETYIDTINDFGILKILPNYDHTYTLQASEQTILKTDTSGAILSSLANVGSDNFTSISMTPDSGYFLTGSRNFPTLYPAGLVKTNSLLDTLWTHTYFAQEFFPELTVNPNDNSIQAASTTDSITNIFGNSDVVLIQLDSSGNSWCHDIDYFDINFQPSANTVISFDSSYTGGNWGASTKNSTWHQVTFLNGFLSDTICSPLAVQEINNNPDISVFPNPVSQNTFKIFTGGSKCETIQLMTVEGKNIVGAVQKTSQDKNEISVSLSSSVPNGVYLLLVESSGKEIPLKLVVMR